MRYINNYLIKIYCLLSLALFSLYNSQVYTLSEVDRMTTKYKNGGNIEDALKYNINALKAFEEEDNREGTVMAYINIGNLLCTLNKYKESLSYLDKAKNEINKVKDPVLQSRLYNEYGRNYAALRLFKQSNGSFDKAIQFGSKISNEKLKKSQLYFSYAWKWDNFDHLDEMDSVYAMQSRCLKLSSEPLVFAKAANVYIIRNIHLDSAEYYLNKALPLTDKYPIHQKGKTLLTFGNLSVRKKENEKALEYYFQALEIFEKMKSNAEIRMTYQYISNAYQNLNNTEKASEYFTKYSQLNDVLNDKDKRTLNSTVEKLLKEQEENEKAQKNKLYFLVFGIVIIALAGIYFIRKVYIKKQKQKDAVIKKKSLETEKLKKQVNSSFDEVIYLAKTADPLFIIRFKEVYPDFYNRLMSECADLTAYDMKFCALLKLNFSNKDIAEYENITLRSTEARRYRLKKKLGLSPETDLKKWIFDL